MRNRSRIPKKRYGNIPSIHAVTLTCFNRPVHVVGNEGNVEEEGEELAGDEEQRVEDVENIFRQHERVEAVALVDGVLVVGLQLVESDDLKTTNRRK